MAFDEELLIRSRKRAEAKLLFYTDLVAYAIVNTALFMVWYFSGQGFPWFLFVLFFWGLGVGSRGVTYYRNSDGFDRMTAAEYKRMLNKGY
jgi:hypothetical protein